MRVASGICKLALLLLFLLQHKIKKKQVKMVFTLNNCCNSLIFAGIDGLVSLCMDNKCQPVLVLVRKE